MYTVRFWCFYRKPFKKDEGYMLKKIEKVCDAFGTAIGNLTSVVLVLMIINVFYDVVMRYFFETGNIGLQELEWHLFSVIILLGMSYTLQQDGHVRVDLIYDNLGARKKAFINIFGTVLFVLPVAAIIGSGSTDYVLEAYQSNEGSGDPGGLPYRWIVKSLIPLSFSFLIVSAVGFLARQINIIKDHKANDKSNHTSNNELTGEKS